MRSPLSIAEEFAIPVVQELKDYPLVKERCALLPYLFAKEYKILPLEEEADHILVATSEPWNVSVLKEVRLLLKKEVRAVFCISKVIEDAIERCYHTKENKLSETKEDLPIKEEAEGYDLLEQNHQNPVVRFLNTVLLEGIQMLASDIHFEPQEKELDIRFRIDGILQKKFNCPFEFQMQLVTRLKVMAKLDIAEHRQPQDGRIKLKVGARQIDFRVSTIPVIFGERIVLRLLDPENVLLGMSQIGMQEPMLSSFRKILQMPEGIILVTGPTGSGKTTTLYSALMEMNADELNIMTIEDPVEYKLPKIAQMGVNPKIHVTFQSGLRHILRQDPDLIMIGEIRDKETAEIAVQAALTGHLVLSTLHTNDAPSAITRLSDMGIEPYLLSSSILGILAQRLVRKICSYCKISYVPAADELKELDADFKKVYKGQGCPACFHTGYKGRHGLFELMPVNAEIRKAILKSQDASFIREKGTSEIFSLHQSAKNLVKEGVTTVQEAIRLLRNFD
ncbi:MAG TPA: ATPase, T2SS/T4P/T4SS family [Chlamydiales bacterium]|nr:ATPase, T2SS/T4P/T4SS family [Chlamydiales bacterium]